MSTKISLNLGEVKEIFKPFLYHGAGLVRIAKTDKNDFAINLDRTDLSKIMPNVSEDGDEFVYTKEIELTKGYTGFSDGDGLKRMEQTAFDALDYTAKAFATGPQKVNQARVSLAVYFEVEKIKEGKPVKETAFDILSFSFLESPRFDNEGKKMQVFNAFGEIAWIGSDKIYPKDFNTTQGVWPAPDKFGTFGIEELIDFVKAYGAIPKGVPLFATDNIDVYKFFEGDFSGLESILMFIEEKRTVKNDGKIHDFTGVIALGTPHMSKNMIRQGFYNKFAQGVEGKMAADSFKHSINTTFSAILNNISKSRKPNKKGQIFSPESNGVFISLTGSPTFGFKEISEEQVRTAIEMNDSTNLARPTPIRNGNQSTGTASVVTPDNPFGV